MKTEIKCNCGQNQFCRECASQKGIDQSVVDVFEKSQSTTPSHSEETTATKWGYNRVNPATCRIVSPDRTVELIGNFEVKEAKAVCDHINNSYHQLKSENEELKEWKRQQLLVWGKVDDFVRPTCQWGDSVSDEALKRLKEYDELKSENERLKKTHRADNLYNGILKADNFKLQSDNEAKEKRIKELEALIVKCRPYIADQNADNFSDPSAGIFQDNELIEVAKQVEIIYQSTSK